ncbi:hypothetical protein [Micromonospora sp. NPDC005171]|uniref:hypothetical protein n=1 Tax=Micromonospora sp. NPDC005171 TaxID=3156866 RepID=UPI0033BD3EFD
MIESPSGITRTPPLDSALAGVVAIGTAATRAATAASAVHHRLTRRGLDVGTLRVDAIGTGWASLGLGMGFLWWWGA